MGRQLCIRGVVVLLGALLGWPTTAAEPSFDGGVASLRWRGTGTGAVASTDEAGPLAGVGFLALQVEDTRGRVRLRRQLLSGLDLREPAAAETSALDSAQASAFGGISVVRQVRLLDEGGLRQFDQFTNLGREPLRVRVVWGGKLKNVIGLTRLPRAGQADLYRGESALVVVLAGGPRARSPVRAVGVELLPRLSAYPGADPSFIGDETNFSLQPGQTRSLLHVVLWQAASPNAAESLSKRATALTEVAALPALMADIDARALARTVNWSFAGAREDDWIDPGVASLSALRAMVVSGRMTVRELAQLHLARIAAFDQQGPRIRAFISLNPDLLRQADALDQRWRASPEAYPLLGSLVAVKDNIAVAGMPLTLGLPSLLGAMPARNATVVERLLQQGALVVGKTNLDELASSVFGLSSAGGSTLNVFAPDRAAGGSSAGSAAAVAAGLASFALGTDTCDSILQPAAQAALVGLRPTYGVLPMAGIAPGYGEQDVVGPLVRQVADAAQVWSALVERAPRGPAAAERERGDPPLRLGHLRLSPPVAGDRLSAPPIARILAGLPAQRVQVVDVAIDLGPLKQPVEATLPAGRYASELLNFIAELQGIDPAQVQRQLTAEPPTLLASPRGPREWIASTATKAIEPATEIAAHRRALDAYREAVVALMDRHRLDGFIVANQRGAPSLLGVVDSADSVCELSAWTGLPALALPAGRLAGTPWPAGLILLGRPGQDDALFAMAARVARASAPAPRTLSLP